MSQKRITVKRMVVIGNVEDQTPYQETEIYKKSFEAWQDLLIMYKSLPTTIVEESECNERYPNRIGYDRMVVFKASFWIDDEHMLAKKRKLYNVLRSFEKTYGGRINEYTKLATSKKGGRAIETLFNSNMDRQSNSYKKRFTIASQQDKAFHKQLTKAQNNLIHFVSTNIIKVAKHTY